MEPCHFPWTKSSTNCIRELQWSILPARQTTYSIISTLYWILHSDIQVPTNSHPFSLTPVSSFINGFDVIFSYIHRMLYFIKFYHIIFLHLSLSLKNFLYDFCLYVISQTKFLFVVYLCNVVCVLYFCIICMYVEEHSCRHNLLCNPVLTKSTIIIILIIY